jgi:hypothetical protein
MFDVTRIVTLTALALSSAACVGPSALDEDDLSDPAALEGAQEALTASPLDAEFTDLPLIFTECEGGVNDSQSSFVDDTSPAVVYSSPWKAETPGLGLYQGTQHITNIGGYKVSHTFNTPGGWSSTISYGYRKMKNAGKAAIYYDGQPIGTISLYAPANVYHCEFSLHDMSPGVHTVMVKVLNQKESVSGGTYVNVDYFRQYDF